MESKELLGCPFCGGKADLHQFTRSRYSVDFSDCDVGMTGFVSEAEAIEKWNVRALKAQPSGVVLPEWLESSRTFVDRLYAAGWRDHADAQHAGAAGLYDELIARLNSSPVSDGATVKQSLTAGGVDERAAFDKWFRYEQMIADHIDTTFISSEFLPYRAWQARAALSPAREDVRGADPVKAQLLENALRLSANRMDRLAIEFAHGSEMRWTVSEWAEESRAALSAPSHGEQVREAVPEELLTRCADWCDKQPKQPWYGRTAGDMVRTFMVCQPLSAALSATAPDHSEQVRDGWRLVPVEPTRAMRYSVENTSLASAVTRQSTQHEIGVQVYAAMLAAAPSAGSGY